MKFAKKLVLVPSDRYEQMQALLVNKEKETSRAQDTSPGKQQQGGGSVTDPQATLNAVSLPSNEGTVETRSASKSEAVPQEPSISSTLEDSHIVDSVGKKI